MDVLYERVMKQIDKAEYIEQQNVGQVTPEMRDLKNELIENKEIIKKIKESAETNPKEGGMLEKKNKGARRKNKGIAAEIKALRRREQKLTG